jgi:hypothetical protein
MKRRARKMRAHVCLLVSPSVYGTIALPWAHRANEGINFNRNKEPYVCSQFLT